MMTVICKARGGAKNPRHVRREGVVGWQNILDVERAIAFFRGKNTRVVQAGARRGVMGDKKQAHLRWCPWISLVLGCGQRQ